MSCGCNEDPTSDITPNNTNHQFPPNPVNYHYNYQCQCGCLELRERVVVLERDLYQLLEAIKRSNEQPEQPKRRFIGDKGSA
jgi:hypothetical protein